MLWQATCLNNLYLYTLILFAKIKNSSYVYTLELFAKEKKKKGQQEKKTKRQKKTTMTKMQKTRYCGFGVISHMKYAIIWYCGSGICNISQNLQPWDIMVLEKYLIKSATMRYYGFGKISHKICNHEIFWFWCYIIQDQHLSDILILV